MCDAVLMTGETIRAADFGEVPTLADGRDVTVTKAIEKGGGVLRGSKTVAASRNGGRKTAI
jgi:hypothetical protein